MIVRARCILPMTGAPVENGAITVENGRIKWLGRWPDCDVAPGQRQIDLGEVALVPGLINAHCHLDYTSMAGQIPPPRTFPDWVKNILAFKAHWSFSEFAESWLKGARMLIERGTTTVADVESVPELPPETWKSTPLRMISFLEMTNVRNQRNARDLLSEALDWLKRWPTSGDKQGALSPHALYSTSPELMRETVRVATEHDLLITTHLAESEAEHHMFSDAKGPFYDWLKGQRKMDDCGRATPVELASEYGLLNERTLVIHANYLTDPDIATLAQARTSVVHCPRSHAYFGHAPFRYAELAKAGVNVCLGTDSLASVAKVVGRAPELDLWSEMQAFAATCPAVSPREIFGMVTTHPARALRKSTEIGAFAVGAWADAAALAYSGKVDERKICEELIYTPAVREVFIGGELVRSPA